MANIVIDRIALQIDIIKKGRDGGRGRNRSRGRGRCRWIETYRSKVMW